MHQIEQKKYLLDQSEYRIHDKLHHLSQLRMQIQMGKTEQKTERSIESV